MYHSKRGSRIGRRFLHCNTTGKKSQPESWKLSLNAEGIKGPLNQRGDFTEAKQTCKRPYHEYRAITWSGNKPIPPEPHVSKSLINNLKASRNTITHLNLLQDDDTILLPQRIHFRHHAKQQLVVNLELGFVEIIILD